MDLNLVAGDERMEADVTLNPHGIATFMRLRGRTNFYSGGSLRVHRAE
jgi:hypothetical protein